MSKDETQTTSPAAEFVKADSVAPVLIQGMIAGWQLYYKCHEALLIHAVKQTTGDQGQVIADYAANAARKAAMDQKPTVAELEQAFQNFITPLLHALGAEAQDEQEDDGE